MSFEADLEEAAHDELERACTLGWKELAAITPWGDTFEGQTPGNRDVCFERSYLWDHDAGGDIRVEITVYEAHAYEEGARLARTIARETASSKGSSYEASVLEGRP